MGRQDDITDEQIAAAELRRVIDDKFDRGTPSIVRRIAGESSRPIGRSSLLNLIDKINTVSRRGEASDAPLIVVEGYAGSGRTTLLEAVRRRWDRVAPTVLVSALALDSADDDIQPVLTAFMLGLARQVPGYTVRFPRTVLAQIAMADVVSGAEGVTAAADFRRRLETYRQPTVLKGLVQNLIDAHATELVPGATTLVSRVAEGLVGRGKFGRWMKRSAWDKALSWFGHQDRGIGLDPVDALLQLGRKAATARPAVRFEVNDLSVAALLADLRDSLMRAKGRPANAMALIDDADTPQAMAFIRSLLDVRRAVDSAESTNPLTVIVTSNGALSEALHGQFPGPVDWEQSRLDDIRVSGMWLRAQLADLSHDDVLRLAMSRNWPPEVATRSVAWAVYRLTHGHPAATTVVLGKLNEDPLLVDHLDRLLEQPGPDPGISVERHLLRRTVQDLRRHDQPGDAALEGLVTLSAARNLGEALSLARLLPQGVGSVLFTSATLWSRGPVATQRHLHPMVRYLGLRALTGRSDEATGWDAVFEHLRADAEVRGDRAGELHHRRMLGQQDYVASDLADALQELPASEWLDLFEEIVATPNPRSPYDGVTRDVGTVSGEVMTLLDVGSALNDPVVTEHAAIQDLAGRASRSMWWIADHVRDSTPFLRMSDTHRRDAEMP